MPIVTREAAEAAVRAACVKNYGATLRDIVVHSATKYGEPRFDCIWSVEVTYSSEGWRAIYGVTTGGKAICWMD